MSRCRVSSPSQDEAVKLSIQLPCGLSVLVCGPARSSAVAADLLRHIALHEPPPTAASSVGSFELVSEPASVSPTVAPQTETRESILRSFSECPAHLFREACRLCGSSVPGPDRIRRAWPAGNWAGAVLSERVGSPNRTPTLDLSSRFYAVVPATWTWGTRHFQVINRLLASHWIP